MNPKKSDVVLGGGQNLLLSAAVLGICNRYSHPDYKQFVRDLAVHQIKVFHYDGRFWWSGPAASCQQLHQVMSRTSVPCVWDEIGKEFIVYPAAYTKDALREALADATEIDIAVGLSQPQTHLWHNFVTQMKKFIVAQNR